MASTEPYVQIACEESPRYENAPSTAPYRVATDLLYLPGMQVSYGPNPSHLARGDEMRGIIAEPSRIVQLFEPGGNATLHGYLNAFTWFLEAAGFTGVRTAGTGTNEVQTVTITGGPTGGGFTLTFGAQTTYSLPYNASAADVQAALWLLSSILPGGVSVTGGPGPATPYVVRFTGLSAATDVATMTAAHTFTGGAGPNIAVSVTTPGVASAITDPDGRKVGPGASKWVFDKRGGAVAKTLQFLLGRPREGVFERGQGVGVASLALDVNGDITADLTGLVYQNIFDPGLTAAFESSAIIPTLQSDLALTWGLSNTAISNDFGVTVANPIQRVRDLSLGSKFSGRMEHTGEPNTLSGTVGKDSLADADIDALLNATTFSATARWRTLKEVGSSGSMYGLWITMPACQYTGGTLDPVAARRRFGGSFNWFAALDEGAGYDARITVVNAVAAINTFV